MGQQRITQRLIQHRRYREPAVAWLCARCLLGIMMYGFTQPMFPTF